MLTSQQSIVRYDNGRALPDRLTRGRHGHYLALAERMLAVYRSGVGRTRRELHQSVSNLLDGEADCDPRRLAAFCKLLDDAAAYHTDPRGNAAALRLRVFSLAARFHPPVTRAGRVHEFTAPDVRGRVAAELGRPWREIDEGLYADLVQFQRLACFEGFADGAALLSRYNVAQLQACLYRAESMTVRATRHFQTVLRYAKLARLLHEIRRVGTSEYVIDLSGPASVLGATRRYGVNFARFAGALLACDGWSLRAAVRTPWGGRAALTVSSRDGFHSHLPPPREFDSHVEEGFQKRFGPERGGWRLSREAGILHDGQATFVPDFVFRRGAAGDGCAGPAGGTAAPPAVCLEVYLEIVGFWTAEYLEKKRQTLRRFRQHRILIAVANRSLRAGAVVPRDVLVYKTSLKPDAVLEALNRHGP